MSPSPAFVASALETAAPCSVLTLAGLPVVVKTLLIPYHHRLPSFSDFTEVPDSLAQFVIEIATPYACVLNKAFPSGASALSDIQESMKTILIPHAGNFLSFLVH
jgi:hypothetical protein